MSFSWKDRQAALASLSSNPPELLIIGSGVVGSSVSSHAAQLGLKVVLIDKEDIAAGASGNSTGLAHAGLRYLAQGRFGYVFREGRERRRLQELAPQWVSPFNFILPSYQEDPYKFWKVQLGTWIYDVLGWVDAFLTKSALVRRHRTLSAEEVKRKVPGIRAEGLVGGIEYYVDAKLQDSRFTLGYAQQAARHGARILTYCRIVSVDASGEGHPRVAIQDYLTGDVVEFPVPLVLNAAGAWIDEVRQMIGKSDKLLQPSKGIHLIVDHISNSPLIMSSAVKGRVFFVIPIDTERTLVGTTDTALTVAPDEVNADSKDVMDLLQQLFYYFPYFKQGPSLVEAIENYKQVHVRDVYCGVRPLLAHGGSSLNASREHRLVKDLPRFWSLPGVKLTAGRAAGYEAAVEVWNLLREHAPMPQVTWDSLPGGELWDLERFVNDAQKRFKLGADSEILIKYLISMYGTRYMEVLQWSQLEAQYGERLVPEEPWILAQAAYAAREEMVLTLNDFLWRRTKWAHYRDLPAEVVRTIAQTLGQFLQWSESEIDSQINAFETELKKHRIL